MAVEDLAAALSLTPGTVVHHLKGLREAGLVESRPRPPYMDYSLRLARLAEIGGQLDRIGRQQQGLAEDDAGPAPDWGGPEAARVLRAFFADDRLVGIPAQHAKRLFVLRYLAETLFEEGSTRRRRSTSCSPCGTLLPRRSGGTWSTRGSCRVPPASTDCAPAPTGRRYPPRPTDVWGVGSHHGIAML